MLTYNLPTSKTITGNIIMWEENVEMVRIFA